MNVVFRVDGGNEALEKKFLQNASEAGMAGVGGHRSVGGMRVSLYNAVPPESVHSLLDFMREFESVNARQ